MALLVESSKGRLEDLLPIRYGRMMASPFAFYRGAAAIMASDLAHTPATGLNVQACGDCHLLNFGGFATAERRLIFDINDFDETCAAPWEWDVKRLAASFVIAGRCERLRGRGWPRRRPGPRRRVTGCKWQLTRRCRCWMCGTTPSTLEEIISHVADKQLHRFYTKKLESATEQSAHEKEFAKLAFAAGDRPRIIDQPPLIFHTGDQRDAEFRKLTETRWPAISSCCPPINTC